jgi:hypothetical protein
MAVVTAVIGVWGQGIAGSVNRVAKTKNSGEDQ